MFPPQAFQQELESRQGMVQTMKSQPTNDPQLLAQIEQLTALWDRVNQLTDIRESRLHEAQKLVSEATEIKKDCPRKIVPRELVVSRPPFCIMSCDQWHCKSKS